MSGPTSLLQRLLLACVTVLLAALALQRATQILRDIWPTLAVAAGVVVGVWAVVMFVRWYRDGW